MSRGGTQKQDTTFNQTQGISSLSGGQASQLFQTLDPIYQSEAVNPQGFGDTAKAAMNTAGQQSTGGATAAVKGQTGLSKLRSGNRGSSGTLLDESVRNAMRQNSQNALGVETQDALLKQTQQQAGISGLQGLYGQNMQQQLQALGLGGSIANNQASQPGWFQNMTGLIGSLAGAGAKGVTL